MKIKNICIILIMSGSCLYGAPEWIDLTKGKARSPGEKPNFRIVDSDAGGLRIKFGLEGFFRDKEIHEGTRYESFRIPEVEPSLNSGKPDVPSLGYLLGVLRGSGLDVKLIHADKKVFKNVNLVPTKEFPLRCGKGVERFTRDPGIYNRDSFYPGEIVEVSKTGYIRDTAVSRLSINPLQYNPVSKELAVYTRLEIQVSYEGDEKRDRSNKKASRAFGELLSGSIHNFRVDSKDELPGEVMLIISADKFLTDPSSLLSEFIEKKEMLGIRVIARKVSEIGNVNTEIKAFIQEAYNTWPVAPTYLLLVGNEDSPVTFKRSTASGTAASDYVYSLLSGDDIFPDLLYGRIVANSIDDANILLKKIMHYEWNPDRSASWYTKAAGIASKEGVNPSDAGYIRQIKEALTAYSYDHMDEFLEGEGNATKENINLALNEGRSWLTYIGHGSGTAWASTNGSYNLSSIDELDNGMRLPIIVDVACLNGQYDALRECFGERWVRSGTVENPRGAVGYWGGSVSISWHPPAIMARGIAKRHFEKPVHTLGGSLIAGQLYLAEQSGTGGAVEDNFEWYNLFGDPSMLIRTGTTREFLVSAGEQIGFGESSFQGEVRKASGVVPGAVVVLYHEELGIVARALTDENGNFRLDFPPFNSPGELFLSISKYNYVPVKMKIALVPLYGSYIVFEKKEVVEESIYSDGRPNPGETIKYNLIIKNIGQQASGDIDFHIITESPSVESYSKRLHSASIDPGSTGTIKGFYFKTGDPVANNERIDFEISWDCGRDSGSMKVPFFVAAPDMIFVAAGVIGDENQNGFVDPGEIAKIELLARNDGSIPSGVGEFLFSSDSPDISFISNTLAFDGVQHGETISTVIEIKVSQEARPGSISVFDIQDPSGVWIRNVLTIPIGTPQVLTVSSEGEALEIKDMQTTESLIKGPVGLIRGIRVRLDITHTYVGDLRISLSSPDGRRITLRNKHGGSADNIHGWIPEDFESFDSTEPLLGMTSGGEWKLEVEDLGRNDEGSLDSWKIEFYGYLK